jgi:1-phosphatidylinositol phosphodiesterase
MPPSQLLLIPLLLLLVGLLVFLLAPVPKKNALYSNSTKQSLPGNAYVKQWMKDLHDDIEVSYLSLPGTHDSGSYNCHFWQLCKSTQCQSWPIMQQLQAGIRFLDLRIQIVNEQLTIIHG